MSQKESNQAKVAEVDELAEVKRKVAEISELLEETNQLCQEVCENVKNVASLKEFLFDAADKAHLVDAAGKFSASAIRKTDRVKKNCQRVNELYLLETERISTDAQWGVLGSIYDEIDEAEKKKKLASETSASTKTVLTFMGKFLSLSEPSQRILKAANDVRNYSSFERGTWDNPLRKRFVENFSWSVPDLESAMRIAEFIGLDKVIGFGSGHGGWERLFTDLGCNVVATDSHPPPNPFMSVLTESNDVAVDNHPECTVAFFSWPIKDSGSTDVLAKMKPKKIVYIGEWEGECLADLSFFKLVEENYRKIGGPFNSFGRFGGCHDNPYLLERID